VFEMMAVTDDVRQLLLAQRATGELRGAAGRHGMRSLREDGLRLVRLGVTSLEEVLRVSSEEDEGPEPS
jgi:general secretion pathway protein E